MARTKNIQNQNKDSLRLSNNRASHRAVAAKKKSSRAKLYGSPESTATAKAQHTQRKKTRVSVPKSAIEAIRDFKLVGDQTFYLVLRSGENAEGSWEPEHAIETPSLVVAFQNRVCSESGYSIVNGAGSSSGSNLDNARPSRTSKTRAMYRIKETRNEEEHEKDRMGVTDEWSGTFAAGPKKRKISSNKEKSSSGASITPRGKALQEANRALVQKRKAERSTITEEDLRTRVSESVNYQDCCLRCTIRLFRDAVGAEDIVKLKEAIETPEHIPHWTLEDVECTGDYVLKTAMLSGNTEAVKLLLEDKKDKRINVPLKYMKYGSTTGYVGRHTFGHAVKKVNESRGNRQGNSAFYHEINPCSMEVDTLKIKDSEKVMTYLHCLADPRLQEEQAVECFQLTRQGHFWQIKGIYFVVASGNVRLALKLIEEKEDHPGFNHLHAEVLKPAENNELKSYRRNQILKKVSDACSLNPLMCASINPSSKYLTELFEQLEPSDRNETDEFGRTIAFFAAASATPDCLNYLISRSFNFSQGDIHKLTPLLQAARFGRHQNIKLLLQYLSGSDTPSREYADHTLLRNKRRAIHYAAYYGHTKTCVALIECGATIDAIESIEKATPLMMASQRGYVDCAAVLLEKGAGIGAVDKYMRTALHLASKAGHYDVVKLLLEQGADSDAADSSHNRPIHYAAGFGHYRILELLIELGGADLAAANVWRSTACSVASSKGHISIVQFLLSHPAGSVGVNFKDQAGHTMLHHCVMENVESSIEVEQNLRKASILLSRQADPNSKNVKGDTVLHVLARAAYFKQNRATGWYKARSTDEARWNRPKHKPLNFGDDKGAEYQRKLVDFLIDAGADLEIINTKGESALAVAMASENWHIVEVLIRRGANYWDCMTATGNNFAHYYLNASASLDSTLGKRQMDRDCKDRLATNLEEIWDAIIKHPIPNDAKETQIDHPNDEGYTAVLQAVQKAIEARKRDILEEKQQVKYRLETMKSSRNYSNNGNQAGGNDGNFKRRDAIFELRFDNLLKYLERIIKIFHPNMSSTVQLSKNFIKSNPKAKKSEYPKEIGYNVLHFAASTQHAGLLGFLMAHGCDPNLRADLDPDTGITPMAISSTITIRDIPLAYLPDTAPMTIEQANKLFNIIKPNYESFLQESLQEYLKYGADPCLPDKTGSTVLIKIAASLNARVLSDICSSINEDSQVDIRDESGLTALMHAVNSIVKIVSNTNKEQIFDLNVITHLLTAKANLNLQYEGGDSVLMKGMRSSCTALVERLLNDTKKPIDHWVTNKAQETPLIVACKMGNEDIFKTYLAHCGQTPLPVNYCDRKKNSPLTLIAKRGNVDQVRILLQLNAETDLEQSAFRPLLEAVKNKHYSTVQMLLEAKADINYQDKHGMSALHYAVQTEKFPIVKLLIDYKADTLMKNKKLQTAMHLAIERTKSQTNRSLRVERLLLQSGADINATDVLGRTPFHTAFTGLDIIPKMRKMTETIKKVKQMIKEATQIKKSDKDIEKYMEKFGSHETVSDQWLEQGKRARQTIQHEKIAKKEYVKDKVIVSEDEKEQLRVYTQYRWEADVGAPERFDPIDIISVLLDHGNIQCDSVDHFGRTPLHYAAITGAFTCTNILISNGVDIEKEDDDKNTPLRLALYYKHVDYSVLLKNLGASPMGLMTPSTGEPVSTFRYSLSQSFMNMAYLIMEGGTTILESLRDALWTGKFHLADILLQSSNNSSLSGSTKGDNQNLWHIISNFVPFDAEIWDEYLDEYLEKLKELDIDIRPDVHNRTPLHYAAMSGQHKLLQYLLKEKTCRPGMLDIEGTPEIWYAVAASSLPCVKVLIGENVIINDENHSAKKDSALLCAIKSKSLDIANLLLSHGAKTDKDSEYGRHNAVMEACLQGNHEMISILAKAGANLDTPSILKRKIENQEYDANVSPIFVASDCKNSKLLEALLTHGANANVVGPLCLPENGRSCFMYNASQKNWGNVELLLKLGKIDINMSDNYSMRSIFYHFFFEREKLKISVYDTMIQYHSPSVSHVDEITGMTPLEAAIRQSDVVLLERFLELGADPNVCSCANVKSKPSRLYSDRVNAMFHAVLHNDLQILKTICQKSKHPINWTALDEQGRTIISRSVNSFCGYSYNNMPTIDYITSSMEKKALKSIIDIKDHKGYKAVDYAQKSEKTNVYDALLALGAKISTIPGAAAIDESTEPMEVDFISLQDVERDADAERLLLQAEVDANKSTQDEPDESTKVKIDPYSKLQNVGQIVYSNGEPMDIMMIKIDVARGYYGCNMFYKLSLIYNPILDLYVLWTRWGSFGEQGMHQKTPFLDKEEALAEFRSIFRSKSGNAWEVRNTNFVHKPGRFQLPHKTENKDQILEHFDFSYIEKAGRSLLSPGVHNTMQLFCNFSNLNTGYKKEELDIPIGQVPQKVVDDAYALLKRIEKLSKELEKIPMYETIPEKRAERKAIIHKIVQESNSYYSLVPRSSDKKHGIRPLLTANDLCNEINRMYNVSYLNFAANVILASKYRVKDKNPLDYAYSALGCQLNDITNDGSEHFSMLSKYIQSDDYEIQHLFSVERAEEHARFKPFENIKNRKLLWHGSQIGNFMGILKQGLRCKPALMIHSGSAFGSGIYFADSFLKSIQYANNSYQSSNKAYSLLLLCEVALGQECEMTHYVPTEYQPEKGHMSVKGLGRDGPDPENAIYDPKGVGIPMGPLVKTLQKDGKNLYLGLNEYIVYDEAQVKIRYLVLVHNANYCFLCQKNLGKQSLDILENYPYDTYNYINLNDYERELTKNYLIQAKKTAKQVVEEQLDEYIKARDYLSKWTTTFDLTRESKVCRACSHAMITMMLIKSIESDPSGLPAMIRNRPTCKYGDTCKTQYKSISHAKKLAHWQNKQTEKKDTSDDIPPEASTVEFLKVGTKRSHDTDSDYEYEEVQEDIDMEDSNDESSIDDYLLTYVLDNNKDDVDMN